MKEFIGTCVGNPLAFSPDALSKMIDNAKEIPKKEFFETCYIDEETAQKIKEYPNDFSFHKYKTVYFFVWSAIEHFYK